MSNQVALTKIGSVLLGSLGFGTRSFKQECLGASIAGSHLSGTSEVPPFPTPPLLDYYYCIGPNTWSNGDKKIKIFLFIFS